MFGKKNELNFRLENEKKLLKLRNKLMKCEGKKYRELVRYIDGFLKRWINF